MEFELKDWKKIEKELIFLSTYRHPWIINLYGVNLEECNNKLKCRLIMELMDRDLESMMNDDNLIKNMSLE
jgi:peroxiredoxin